MYFGFLAIAVFGFFVALVGEDSARARHLLPATSTLQANFDGNTFVSYRNAVALYVKNNPTHTGTVSATALNAQGTSFPTQFLAIAGNGVTSTGVNGRVVTSYAVLPTGAMATIKQATENDASFGYAAGTNWISNLPASTASPLPVAVPNGAVVSVIRVGT